MIIEIVIGKISGNTQFAEHGYFVGSPLDIFFFIEFEKFINMFIFFTLIIIDIQNHVGQAFVADHEFVILVCTKGFFKLKFIICYQSIFLKVNNPEVDKAIYLLVPDQLKTVVF